MPKESLKNNESFAIRAIMTKINGWVRAEKMLKLPIYGPQRVYTREGNEVQLEK
jgi:hypothetical protein